MVGKGELLSIPWNSSRYEGGGILEPQSQKSVQKHHATPK